MKIKRLVSLIGIMILVLSVAGPAAAQQGSPDPQRPLAENRVFLPVISSQFRVYNLSGQVKDAEDLPLSGVTVEIEGGQKVQTDANGVYRLSSPEGSQLIAASKPGYAFEPATADIEVAGNMNNLNFSAMAPSAMPLSAANGCVNLLLDSNFEGGGAWISRPANIPSVLTGTHWFSPVTSMLSGVPVGSVNPFKYEWTTSEFYQTTTAAIPSNARVVQLRMRLLPRSTDLWGYHVAEQAVMDAAGPNMPDATEAQYGFVCTDGSDTNTCNPVNGGRQLFKWFPINSYWWLYRSYDLRAYRGETISILFGASNDGWNGNTALYVDDVYLFYCTP